MALSRSGGGVTGSPPRRTAAADAGGGLVLAAEDDETTGADLAIEARLLAEASHELRGGAARLALMAEALAEQGLTAPVDEGIEGRMRALAAEGRRVQALASALLDTARLAAEGRRFTPEAVSLAAVVEHVVTGQSPPADREVRVRVADDLKVWADPLALDQVLSNLIGNAFQHGGHRVTVDGRADAGRAVVTVADDGSGLPGGSSGALASPPRPGPGRGSGLGLGIAARLVALLDGELDYDTDESGGARFTIRLPTA
jgi:two-component system, OmpR family, phosphate regulon sensor histidine kinase PhoR